jgi:lipoprotein-releasing system ATP-binding protein
MTVRLGAENIVKAYVQGENTLRVLNGISLTINPGEVVALVGQSGAGKSTLLHTIGLLDKPDSGTIYIDGQEVNYRNESLRTALRGASIGFVYQFHYLLPEFSSQENVAMPLIVGGMKKEQAMEEAKLALDNLGLLKRLGHRPKMLSGGEQQRVAIGRALIRKPSLLLADEPTGNLDNQTAEMVFENLLEISRLNGLSALIATHNQDLAQKMDRILELRNGQLYERV